KKAVALFFRPLVLSDVAAHADQADQVAAAVSQGNFGSQNPALLARGIHDWFLEVDQGMAGLDNLSLVSKILLRQVRRIKVEVPFANEILGPGSHQLRHAQVADHETAFRVLDVNEVGE